MSKYRIVVRQSLGPWWCVQERHWWGWKTVARCSEYYGGMEEAKKILEELKTV